MNLNFITIKLRKVGGLLLGLVILSATTFSCITPSASGGCAGPGPQGWSGFVSYNDVLYFGSMDGKVLALTPSSRSRGLPFPGDGEWSYIIKASIPSGSMCGSACGPAASGVKIYSTPVAAEG